MTTRARSRAAEINKSLLRRPLVEGEVQLEATIADGLSFDCTLQRDWTVLIPLAHRTFRDAKSLGGGGLCAPKVVDNIGLSHRLTKYSMLNRQVKDAGPVSLYAGLAMETMGDRIRQLRKARGLTQEQFAKLVGVTKSAVSQWEDGSTKNLKLATFLRACEVLVTDPEYLIWGDDRAPSGAAAKKTWKSRPGGRQPET